MFYKYIDDFKKIKRLFTLNYSISCDLTDQLESRKETNIGNKIVHINNTNFIYFINIRYNIIL